MFQNRDSSCTCCIASLIIAQPESFLLAMHLGQSSSFVLFPNTSTSSLYQTKEYEDEQHKKRELTPSGYAFRSIKHAKS